MTEQTSTTAKALDYLMNDAGLSMNFLHDVSKYSPSLLRDAHRGYIDFFGHTLGRLENLKDFCEKVAKGKTVLSAKTILEDHFIVYEKNGKSVFASLGALIIAGEKTYDEAISIAHSLTEVSAREAVEDAGAIEDDDVVKCLESRRYEIAAKRGRYTPIKQLA